ASPLLLGIARGSINEVTIDTPDSVSITNQDGATTISGTPESTIQLQGLDIGDRDNPVADHLTLTTLATDDFILATIQQQMAEATGGNSTSQGFAEQLIQELIKV